jgi:hypothetical protein
MPSSSCSHLPEDAAAQFRARTHAHTCPMSAALSCRSGGVCWLLAVTVAVAMMNAAFGVALAQGTWSTAQLSVKRYLLAATSVGNEAIFAGGSTGGAFVQSGWLRICGVFARGTMLWFGLLCDHLLSLTRAAAGSSGASNVVDMYNSATGVWSTAQLSVPRYYLAAASVGSVAIFAGGYLSSSALLCRVG